MKNIIFAVLTTIASIIIISSFFMPWVAASTSVMKVGKTITGSASPFKGLPFVGDIVKNVGEASDIVGAVGDVSISTVVSGYNIPAMVNSKSSKIALSFAQSFFGDVKDLDKKSMLVYLLPIFAVVCIILSIIAIWYKISVIPVLIISGAISLGGLYALKTTDLSNATVRITIEKGLWNTMYAYLFIFILSIAWIGFEIAANVMKKR